MRLRADQNSRSRSWGLIPQWDNYSTIQSRTPRLREHIHVDLSCIMRSFSFPLSSSITKQSTWSRYLCSWKPFYMTRFTWLYVLMLVVEPRNILHRAWVCHSPEAHWWQLVTEGKEERACQSAEDKVYTHSLKTAMGTKGNTFYPHSLFDFIPVSSAQWVEGNIKRDLEFLRVGASESILYKRAKGKDLLSIVLKINELHL